jgi:high-affinity iron transporter
MIRPRTTGFMLLVAASLFCGESYGAPGAPTVQEWNDALDTHLLDYYETPENFATTQPAPLDPVVAGWSDGAKGVIADPAAPGSFALTAGRLRARLQQAIVLEMAAKIRAEKTDAAKALRAELYLPRGVSANEGALLLQSLGSDKRDEAARILIRESITWQTTRVRQLFDESVRTAQHNTPLPGRLMERLGEALTLADLPAALRAAAELGPAPEVKHTDEAALLAAIASAEWSKVAAPLIQLRDSVEARLPSLLSEKERTRRERLLLKLVQLVPKEYSNGVRDGQVVVPLEYREAVTFTQQARQIMGELAPLWLAPGSHISADAVRKLETLLSAADEKIDKKRDKAEIVAVMSDASDLLRGDFTISLRRSGTTGDIVDEVMLETRQLLNSSLAMALAGEWAGAERLRVEAYTTYDPELEARLMPRDPSLAKDIERLLLDGINEPGVKVLLDRHASQEELTAAYAAVHAGLEKAAVLLKSGISPTAAAMSAISIVIREGLEGILVIVAILAGLRGPENARRRKLIWTGILASAFVTAMTWVLSQTLITSLRAYGETIAAVTGILAIAVLLVITNWLFHQIYWRQWVSTLKHQAVEGENVWQLMTVGFLIGYREGFEVVLFLQSLILDAGGQTVGIGVAIGCAGLLILGVAALKIGLKLPYFKILLVTALLIGLVLITFVGGTVRAAQTIGWLPVHRLTDGSWPAWMGNWFGFHNTVESVLGQVATMVLVLGTWRVARWQAKRKAASRRALDCNTTAPCAEEPADCCIINPELKHATHPVELRISATAHQPAAAPSSTPSV